MFRPRPQYSWKYLMYRYIRKPALSFTNSMGLNIPQDFWFIQHLNEMKNNGKIHYIKMLMSFTNLQNEFKGIVIDSNNIF